MKWLKFRNILQALFFNNRNVTVGEMSRKSFHICVDFDVHAVTCPGVWLCPKGRIELRIAMLGLSVNTKAIAPSFPLLFHEKFRFHKMLRSVNSLTALQSVLKSRNLHIQLLHTSASSATGAHSCGGGSTTVLATFRSPIADVFYPSSPASHNLNAGTDVDLLLKPTACFPGIISPKAEISTRVVIEEVVNYCSPERVINPVTVSSKAENAADDVNPLVRQRAVCHSASCQCCDCYKAKNNATEQAPFVIGPIPRRPSFRPKKQKRLTKTRNKTTIIENEKDKEEISHICDCEQSDEEGSTVCKCILCRKYKDYFPTMDYTSSDMDKIPKAKPKENECKYCCGDQKQMKKQKKSSFPAKQLENCCPCMLIKKIPMPEEFGGIDENDYRLLLKDKKQNGGNCNCSRAEHQQLQHRRSLTVLKSAVDGGGGGGVGGGGVTTEMEGGCSCGIYSCPDWRRRQQAATNQREEHRRITGQNGESLRHGRKNFYLSLEEYYRQLYARARQRSSSECVNSCA